MSTFVIYGNGNDGDLWSSSNTYSTAQSGGTIDIDYATGQMAAGQERGTLTTYYIVYSLLDFGTGVLAGLTPSSVTLSLACASTTYNKVTHTQRVYARDWGGVIETTDWVNPTSFANADILAYLSSSGLSAGTRYNFTSNSAFTSAISTSGPTRLLVTSDEAVAGSAPTDDEEVYWYRSDTAGTTSDPKLTVVTGDISYPTVISVGTEVKNTNTTVTPTLPADIADNDILVCFVAYRSGTPSLDQSYTKKATHTNGSSNLDIWYKRVSGSQTAPAVSGCTNSVVAQLICVRGATTSGDPFEAYSDTAATGTDTTEEAPSLTTSSAKALVVGGISTADDNAHNITGTGNLDAIELLSYTQNTSGTQNSLCIWAGRRDTAGAIGSVVVTQVVNGADAWTHVVGAITPASITLTGTVSSTLTGILQSSLEGGQEFSGEVASTLAPVTDSLVGALEFSGVVDATVAPVICSAASFELVNGAMEANLTSVVSAEAEGVQEFIAEAASTVASVTAEVAAGIEVFGEVVSTVAAAIAEVTGVAGEWLADGASDLTCTVTAEVVAALGFAGDIASTVAGVTAQATASDVYSGVIVSRATPVSAHVVVESKPQIAWDMAVDDSLWQVTIGNSTIGMRDITHLTGPPQFTHIRPGGPGAANLTLPADAYRVCYNEAKTDMEVVINYDGELAWSGFILPRGIQYNNGTADEQDIIKVDCGGMIERLKRRDDYGRIWADPDTSTWKQATDDDTGTSITLEQSDGKIKFIFPSGSDPSTSFIKNVDYELHEGLITDQSIVHVKGTWYGNSYMRWKLQSKATLGGTWVDETSYYTGTGHTGGEAFDITVDAGTKFLRLVVSRAPTVTGDVTTWSSYPAPYTTTDQSDVTVSSTSGLAAGNTIQFFDCTGCGGWFNNYTYTVDSILSSTKMVVNGPGWPGWPESNDVTETTGHFRKLDPTTSDEYITFQPITVYCVSGTPTINSAMTDIMVGAGLGTSFVGDTALDASYAGALVARKFTNRVTAANTVIANAPSLSDWYYLRKVAKTIVLPLTSATVPRGRWFVVSRDTPGVQIDYYVEDIDTPDYVYVIYSALGVTGVEDGTKLGVYRPSTPPSTIVRVVTQDISGNFMSTADAQTWGDVFLARESSSAVKATIVVPGGLKTVDGQFWPAPLIQAGDWIDIQDMHNHQPIYITGSTYSPTDHSVTLTTGGREKKELIIPGLTTLPKKPSKPSSGSDSSSSGSSGDSSFNSSDTATVYDYDQSFWSWYNK